MVRVLAVADEVIDSLRVGVGLSGRPDLILAAGDLPFDYLEELSTMCTAPCVFVPGNHDRDLAGFRRGRSGWMRAGMPTTDPGPAGAVNADGRTVTVAGVRISGLGGSPRYSAGPNQYSEMQQRLRSWKVALRARHQTDVLLTHSPARGIGDREDRPHRGFRCFHAAVRSLRPSLMIHGHVHPYGTTPHDQAIGTATSMNVVGYCEFDFDTATGATTILRRRHGA